MPGAEVQPQRILILDNGARGHATAVELAKDSTIELFVARGNAGTGELATNIDIDPDNIDEITAFAIINEIDLVFVGSEVALAKGITDELEKTHIAVFGPNQEAARLESGKAYAVEFAKKHDVPHPKSVIFNDHETARQYILNTPVNETVLKYNWLAAGKGVLLPETEEQALGWLDQVFNQGRFQTDHDPKVVIQQRKTGREFSVFAFTDGKNAKPTPAVQDYKPIGEGDTGANTGSMGCVARPPFVTDEVWEQAQEILQKTMEGLKAEDINYRGMLYLGLMLTDEGEVTLIEYNSRPGDPEWQVLMALLDSDSGSALAPILTACANQKLEEVKVKWKQGSAACVVLASDGYPGEYKKGIPIHGLDQNYSGVTIYHAGTALDENGKLITNGGRVLNVVATGETYEEAVKRCLEVLGPEYIFFEGGIYRKDIGFKAT